MVAIQIMLYFNVRGQIDIIFCNCNFKVQLNSTVNKLKKS